MGAKLFLEDENACTLRSCRMGYGFVYPFRNERSARRRIGKSCFLDEQERLSAKAGSRLMVDLVLPGTSHPNPASSK